MPQEGLRVRAHRCHCLAAAAAAWPGRRAAVVRGPAPRAGERLPRAPRCRFGTYYRVIQQYMIDMENLWQLLGKSTAVVDKPGAKDLAVVRGACTARCCRGSLLPAWPLA